MRSADREKAVELRIKQQLGYGMIAKQLNVPKSTLSYWLKDLPLSSGRVLELRREAWGRGEASRELFRQTMRKKKSLREDKIYAEQKSKLGKLSRQSLFVAGLMLYAAEGSKQNDYTIALANTDFRMIKFFIWWLEEFFDIPRAKMRAQLHLYESMNIDGECKYWRQELALKKSQFYKNQVRKLRPSSFTYSGSYRHGTCKIYVHG